MTNNYNSPTEIANEFCTLGSNKAKTNNVKFIILAILGGIFIAFGGLLSVVVAGGMPSVAAENPGLVKFMSGAVFPIGLIMVSLAGADLFTSDCAVMTMSCIGKNVNIKALMKILILSYIFNFLGTQIVAYFMTAKVGLLSSEPWLSYIGKLANAKIHQDFWTVLIKGIGANWMVCLGTWMGYSAKDVTGKSLGIWIPVMLFVTLGYEHSIANMFFVPAAIYSGIDISWHDFIIKNLVPATIGNLIGGMVMVGCIYGYVYKK